MAFVDMPKPVEKVMHRLFAPKFDVSLEEIEDTVNILNCIQDETNRDERGKLLQSLITVMSGEPSEVDFKQAILKSHPSLSLKPDLTDSLVNLVKEMRENKEHPLLCQPLHPDKIQSASNSLRNENESIFFPNCWDNCGVNFSDVGDSNMMEQVVMTSFPGATELKDGQGCKKHVLLIPGCAKLPMSRMMYEQEGTNIIDNDRHQASMGAGWCPETMQIAEELKASNQLFKKEECSWNSAESSSMMTNQSVETAPMGSTVSMDNYDCILRDGRISSSNFSSKDIKIETRSQEEGASRRTARYHTNNEVLLHKVGRNCIMVAVKDKTNRFILPKPVERCMRMDKNDMELVTIPAKGVSAKSKTRKRRGIDVMALCGGYKVGKVSAGNSGFSKGKASRVNTRKACEAGNSGLECLVGTSTSAGHLKESGPWENVPEWFSTPLWNDSQQAKQCSSENEWAKSDGKRGCWVVSSPCNGGLGTSSVQEISLKEKGEIESLMSVSNEGTLKQLLQTDDLEADGVVGKDKTARAAGEKDLLEEEDPDVLIIDEDPPAVVDSDDNDSTMDEEKSHGTTDGKLIDNTRYWKSQCWMPTVQDPDDCNDQSKDEGTYCEQANSSRKADQEKDKNLQRQTFQSNLVSESSPWCSPYMMHFNTTSSNAPVDFKETDQLSNTSDASSLDASSSADSLSLSQGSVGESLMATELPEHSFLFNLLKCNDEVDDGDGLIKFSWIKVMPKKKAKLRRSRRTRRAKVAYEN